MNIIDIGSNSVRIMADGKKTVITTRLAENMKDDMLNELSMSRTAAAVKTLCDMADGKCCAFATEAVRRAKNKGDFLALVKNLTGLSVDVLSGEAEAEISYIGATMGSIGDSAVIDLGGASCEIIFGKDKKIFKANSYPFGCVVLKDRFGNDLEALNRFIIDTFDLPKMKADAYLAVGGTATALAAAHLALDVYDPNKVNGHKLTAEDISGLIDEIIGGKDFPTLGEARRKTIVQGAAALRAVMKISNIPVLTVSEHDNLEGYKISRNIL